MGKFKEKYQELSDRKLLELYNSFEDLEPEAKKDIQEVLEARELTPEEKESYPKWLRISLKYTLRILTILFLFLAYEFYKSIRNFNPVTPYQNIQNGPPAEVGD